MKPPTRAKPHKQGATDPAPDFPRLLAVRLGRRDPGLGFSFLIGAIMTAVAAGAWLLGHKFADGESASWPLDIFAGVFAFFGLVVLFFSFRQLLMSRTPVPLVELSAHSLHIGQTAHVALIQRGPAKLKSLRAKLVCLEQHITWHEHTDGEPFRKVDEKKLHTQDLISASPVIASAGSDWHAIEECTIPLGARPSQETDTHAILWQIEIWGKRPLLGSFLHSYEIKVNGAA